MLEINVKFLNATWFNQSLKFRALCSTPNGQFSHAIAANSVIE